MDLSDLRAPPQRKNRLQLVKGRVHEASGSGAPIFALAHGAAMDGPIFWIWPTWKRGMLHADGLGFLTERITMVRPANDIDTLWAAEEVLRSGTAKLVVAETRKPLNLTQGRRLQLAAGEGGSTGLLLIAKDNGCPAAETRWECDPIPSGPGQLPRHRWRMVKDKKGQPGEWEIGVDLGGKPVIWSDEGKQGDVTPPPPSRAG